MCNKPVVLCSDWNELTPETMAVSYCFLYDMDRWAVGFDVGWYSCSMYVLYIDMHWFITHKHDIRGVIGK